MIKTLITGLFVATALVSGNLQAADDDPILHRQHLMEETRDAVKPIGGMLRGKAPFDAATVAASLDVLERVAGEYGNYFPPGSETGHETEARPEIWTDRAGFDARLTDFADAVAAAKAANPQTLEALGPVANGIFDSCKGCHEGYRIEKD